MKVHMSDLQFENESFALRNSVKKSGFTDFLIKNGFASTEEGANKILIGAAIIFFALAIFVAVGPSFKNTEPAARQSPLDSIPEEQRNSIPPEIRQRIENPGRPINN